MNTKLLAAMATAMTFAGCAGTPTMNPALENARAAVRAAEADPNVGKYEALDLQAAKNELQEADSAAMKHDEADIAQPAYMAAQTARLAQLKASAKADDARVAAGQTERDRIQLNARTTEVESAKLARDQANQKASDANQKANALQSEVDALNAKPTDRGLVLTLGDVLFDTGKAGLNPGASRNLDQLVQFLTEHGDRRVEIDGYTDSVGTDSFNLDLSQRRADTVKSVLVSRGIDPSRIVSRGYGKDFEVASNSEAGGRQLNRRVEIVIGGENGAAVAARSHS
jgi:outer membrane protein OmpA-like peptidoglycan-associated protein